MKQASPAIQARLSALKEVGSAAFRDVCSAAQVLQKRLAVKEWKEQQRKERLVN